MDVHVTGLLHFLQAIKERSSQCRLFYAASSLIFGDAPGEAQDEQTPLNPTCVYGITKATGVQCCRLFRATHGVFSSVGILYNHESALRRETFVSQKIVQGAWRIQRGQETKLVLGDLSAEVDWGYAPDFTEAMTKILALDAPDDFVIATGELHSIREFVTIAFGCLGLDWRKHVEEDPALLGRKRSTRRGNPAKLQALCGWRPSVSFEEMIHLLIEAQRDVR